VLVLQLWLYATPIIYPVSLVPERLRSLYFLNPMAGIVEAYRVVILRGELPGSDFGISALVSVVVLFVGYGIFRRVEHKFADVI
jgi:lipopolysaccharide transport system permease protein